MKTLFDKINMKFSSIDLFWLVLFYVILSIAYAINIKLSIFLYVCLNIFTVYLIVKKSNDLELWFIITPAFWIMLICGIIIHYTIAPFKYFFKILKF